MFLAVGDGRGIWCILEVCLYLAGHTSVPPCLGGVVVRARVGHVAFAGAPVLGMGQEPRSILRCALYAGDGSEGRCRLDCLECAPWCGRVVGSGEAGSDPRGHLGVTWGVYLCAGKRPLADIILSHPPDLTRCDSVIGLAIPAMSGHIQYRGAASGDLYIGISGINRVFLS